MTIGIDISQLAYPRTGVANYLNNLVQNLIKDQRNEYILFFSSFRGNLSSSFESSNVKIKKFKMPPMFLDLIWNKLHILPIEKFIGPIDLFITSDWTEPPSKAKKATILYDLVVYKYPQETDKKIINTQKKKLSWVKKETERIFCISDGTAKDAREILGIPENKLTVVYPGL
jgi:hypothetical protein